MNTNRRYLHIYLLGLIWVVVYLGYYWWVS